MRRKEFTIYGVIIFAAMGFLIGLSIQQGNFLVPPIAMAIGILLYYALKARIKEIIEDERIHSISEKASRRTLQIVGIGSAVSGLALVGLSRSNILELARLGFSLAYFATALLMTYVVFYLYYSSKFGA